MVNTSENKIEPVEAAHQAIIQSDSLGVEYGARGVGDVFGTYTAETPQRPEISLTDLARMIMTDGQVRAMYSMVTLPLINAKIHVRSKHGRANAEANFVRRVLFDSEREGGMRTKLRDVMRTIARAVLDGFSPHEIVWKISDDKKIVIDKLAYRPARSMFAITDPKGDMLGAKQKGGFPGVIDQPIPNNKLLWFTVDNHLNHIYGSSFFNTAYYHFEKKHKLYYIAHIASQLNATGAKVLTPPDEEPTPAARDLVVKAVSNLGFNSTVYMPLGWELKIEQLSTPQDLLPLIKHHDLMIAKSVLAHFVEGDFANIKAADQNAKIFVSVLDEVINGVIDILNNHLIPLLIDYNFKSSNYPTLQYEPAGFEKFQIVKDMFSRIASSRFVNTSPDFMQEMEKRVATELGFDIDYEDVQFPDLATGNDAKPEPRNPKPDQTIDNTGSRNRKNIKKKTKKEDR